VKGTAQHLDSGIVAWMWCVRVNSMWKVLHSSWTVVLWLECSVLQWTVCGRYCTACGQRYCGLNGVCYSEQYVEGTAQQVDRGIVAWMECVTVNSMWKVLHFRWRVLLWLEWSVLQWTICVRYCTADGQWYCSLNGVCYSENYVDNTAQQVNSCNKDWMNCVTVNIMGSYCTTGGQRYCSFNVVCYSEHYVEGTAQQVDSGFLNWMECVTVNIMWKVLHSRWTVVL
jgi:hypothetical protein